jgi:hypothetical protein
MRKINVLEFVSLDGVIQAPGANREGQVSAFFNCWWASANTEVS